MSRPDDYRLILPEGWFRIDLEPGTREKSIAALVMSLQTAAGFPLSAALVVTLIPPHEHDLAMVTPARLAETLTGDGRQVTITDLPAGQAVRVRNEDPPVTNLDIHIPLPGSSAYLLLSFSTPLAPLADALVGMFDAIAGTLRWIP